jgi:glucosamine kinase
VVHEAAAQCLRLAGFTWEDSKIVACLALAGAGESFNVAASSTQPHAFYRTLFTTDAKAACIGAHSGGNGGVVIIGTGSIGWAIAGAKEYRVGGWGFPVSDEGSGAWIGCEAIRRVLWACDGVIAWTAFLRAVFERFDGDARTIVRWKLTAQPRDYGSIAPTVAEYAGWGDPEAEQLMRRAAGCIDRIAGRLRQNATTRLALMGGLADKVAPFLSERTKKMLVSPLGDALSGAIYLARAEAERLAPSKAQHHG